MYSYSRVVTQRRRMSRKPRPNARRSINLPAACDRRIAGEMNAVTSGSQARTHIEDSHGERNAQYPVRKIRTVTRPVSRTANATDLGLIDATAQHTEAVSQGNPLRDAKFSLRC